MQTKVVDGVESSVEQAHSTSTTANYAGAPNPTTEPQSKTRSFENKCVMSHPCLTPLGVILRVLRSIQQLVFSGSAGAAPYGLQWNPAVLGLPQLSASLRLIYLLFFELYYFQEGHGGADDAYGIALLTSVELPRFSRAKLLPLSIE